MLGKVLRNILGDPTEAKYRRLRLGNKRIQETVVDVSGGVALLQVCWLSWMARNIYQTAHFGHW